MTGTVTDVSGARATVSVTVQYDGTTPTVTAVPASPANAAGWYNTAVTIHYRCDDTTSGVATCSADQVLHGDSPAVAYRGTATDVAGNVSTVSGSAAIDETPPTVTAAAMRGPDHGVWYSDPVVVHFTCADATSGVAACPADQSVTADGTAIIAAGAAVDVAGNTANATVTVPMDRTAPTIAARADRAPNGAGWYDGPVTIHYSCADATSGVTVCPPDQVVVAEGVTTAHGDVTDNAGNTASVSASVKIDHRAPTIAANPDRPADAGDWYSAPVTVRYTCTDTVSAVAVCPSDQTVAADGTTTVTGTAIDNAGNTSTASLTVQLDQLSPTVTAAAAQAPNANGWNNAPVTVTFTCTDRGSGVATCPADHTVTGDGDHTVEGAAVDHAGNTAAAKVTVRLDGSAPALILNPDRAANGAGWYSAPVTVHATCVDATSGIATCPADRTVDSDGTTTVGGTATDRADNATTATLAVSVDQTPPAITAVSDRAANAAGWYSAPVTVHYTCADATSGIATCPSERTVATDGLTTVAAAALDRADNTATATTDIRLDRTPPSIVASLSGTVGDNGWHRGPVTIHYTCADNGSGIAVCPADQTITTDGTTNVTGAATDIAGNQITASVAVLIDQRPPSITASASQPPNPNGWNNTPVTIHYLCADTTAGVAVCPADQTITTDGTATVTGVAVDRAGNTATVAVTVSVDRTGPTVVLTPARAADADGWYQSAVTIHATCIDSGSGIATCPGDQTVTADGNRTVTATAVDRASNTATATLTIRMDRSPPVIVATAAGTAGTQLVHRAGHHPLHLHRQRLRGGRLPRRPNRHRRRHHHS